jgi:hypothetical protein
MQAAEAVRRQSIPLRTLHQKWSQLFYVSNQNLSALKKRFQSLFKLKEEEKNSEN